MTADEKAPSADRPLNPSEQRGLSRRQFVQGLAATPFALGAGAALQRGAVAGPVPGGRGGRVARQGEKTKISFWSHTHPPMDDHNNLPNAEFVKANPDIKIDYQIFPSMNFAEKMLSSMSTGTGPDIINMDDNHMRSIYIPTGLVQEVDPAALGFASLSELQAAYIPGAFEGGTVAATLYG